MKEQKLKQQYDKPAEPPTYNGAPSFCQFDLFVGQFNEYARTCHIRCHRRIIRIANFLRGNTHNFYTNRVQPTINEWALEQFFCKLFDHCFPMSVHLSYHKKNRECKQNGRPFDVWYQELKDIAGMIGDVNDRQ
ncbi:hypothetical protein SCHPADRAFT_836868, partial [Schizopora paradoxa]